MLNFNCLRAVWEQKGALIYVLAQIIVFELAIGVVAFGQSEKIGMLLISTLQCLWVDGKKLSPVRFGVKRC